MANRPVSIDTLEGLEQTFTYHPPHGDQPARYVALRDLAKTFAGGILTACPQSAERTLALRHVQQAVMFANASIAIHDQAVVDDIATPLPPAGGQGPTR